MKNQRPKKPDVNETAFAVVMAAIGEHSLPPSDRSPSPVPDAKPERKPSKPQPAPKKPRKPA